MVKNSHFFSSYSVRNGRVYLDGIKLTKRLLAAVCVQLYSCLISDSTELYLVKSKPSFHSLSYNHLVSAFCALVRDLCIFCYDCADYGIIHYKGIYSTFLEKFVPKHIIKKFVCLKTDFSGILGYIPFDGSQLDSAVPVYFDLDEVNNYINLHYPSSKFVVHIEVIEFVNNDLPF